MQAEIRKIVHGGWGLAFHESNTVFIPYSAPGDTVEFSVVRKKKNSLFGRVTRIVTPSPLRREPECPVFGTCGGCHFQHLSYENELAAKRETILENLARLGRIKTELKSLAPSPSRYGYRNHAVVKVDGEGRLGFTMMESDVIVPFPPQGCLLLPEEMRNALSALPPEAVVPGSEVRVRMDKFGAVHFWGLADRVGPPEVLMETNGLLFPLSPDSFFQVNRFLGGSLMDLVVSLPLAIRRKLLDLYCGVGFFTLGLSRMVGEAVGIEIDAGAVRSATAAARLNHITNVRFKRADAELEIGASRDSDLVLIDPPRLGVPKAVLRGILRLKPRELIFVSCDPPTFARDAAALIEAGFILQEVSVVDLFPATYHAEIVALFRSG
jgi:23S rRNA (uracil1939-C5)-methyltransferase